MYPARRNKKIIPVFEERFLIKERTGANLNEFGQMFKMNPIVDDIPDKTDIMDNKLKKKWMRYTQEY